MGQSPFALDTFHHHSSLRRRLSSPCAEDKQQENSKNLQEASKAQDTLQKQIEVSIGSPSGLVYVAGTHYAM